MKTGMKNLKKCLTILSLCLFANNFCYGQKNDNDSVIMSMDEVRKMAYIINENTFLRNENCVLDSLVSYSSHKIELLEINLDISKRQTGEVINMFNDCMEMDVLRQEQINAIQKQHKKDKRRTILTAGSGGVLIGIILMLIF